MRVVRRRYVGPCGNVPGAASPRTRRAVGHLSGYRSVVDDSDGAFAPVVDQVVGYATDGTSVHVVGPRSSGRSQILRAAAEHLSDAGYPVVRLYGIPAWRDHPFGVLTATGIGRAPAPGARPATASMVDALLEHLRPQSIVVCDDADDLDPHSAGALLAVHRQRPFAAITSSRPHHPLDPDSLLLGFTPAVRITAPRLDLDQVHGLVRRQLGAPVDAGTLARITMTSGGLAGLAVAITVIGRRAGLLVQRHGIWTAPGELWTDHLAAVVEPFLAGADDALWEAATVLALAGPVPLDQAEKLIEPVGMQRLFASGLVHHLVHEDRTLVGVYPPLLAEYLRREGSAYGLARATDLVDVEADGARPDPIEAGGADAAVLNLALVRQSAERAGAARATWSAAPTPEHAVALIDALRFSAAASARIEDVITATRIEGTDAGSAAAAQYACTVATWRAVGQNDLAEALAVLGAAAADVPGHTGLLDATRAHLILARDHVPDPDSIIDPAVRVGALAAAGRVDEARAVLAGFSPDRASSAAQVSVYAGLVDVLAGNIDAGIEHAHRQLNIARRLGDPLLILGNAYVATFGLLMAGRLADAAHLVHRTLSATRIASYREVLHTGVLVWGAEVAISQGRVEQGRTLAAQALAADRGAGPFPGMVPAILAGLDQDAPEDLPARLWTVVLDRLEHGYVASALTIAVEAVERSIDIAAAERVAAAAARTQGRLLPAAGTYVAALAAEDPDLLATARDSFEQTGASFYAVRASVSRALLLRTLGRADEAAAEVDLAWHRSAAAGLERAGLFHRLVAEVALSARELEIIRMIARPMSTVEVAAALHMSVRTVETHLHNASRKLGIAGRDALVTAATTWLSGA